MPGSEDWERSESPVLGSVQPSRSQDAVSKPRKWRNPSSFSTRSQFRKNSPPCNPNRPLEQSRNEGRIWRTQGMGTRKESKYELTSKVRWKFWRILRRWRWIPKPASITTYNSSVTTRESPFNQINEGPGIGFIQKRGNNCRLDIAKKFKRVNLNSKLRSSSAISTYYCHCINAT
jgi:hypothetical protein